MRQDNTPIAYGGLRPLAMKDERTEEAKIKRTLVLPEPQGRSKRVADLIMSYLERQAVQRGLTTLRLDTAIDVHQARRFL